MGRKAEVMLFLNFSPREDSCLRLVYLEVISVFPKWPLQIYFFHFLKDLLILKSVWAGRQQRRERQRSSHPAEHGPWNHNLSQIMSWCLTDQAIQVPPPGLFDHLYLPYEAQWSWIWFSSSRSYIILQNDLSGKEFQKGILITFPKQGNCLWVVKNRWGFKTSVFPVYTHSKFL